MELEEFKFYKDNRAHLRAKVTRFLNKISEDILNYDISDCKSSLEDLDNFKSKLEIANQKIANGIYIHVSNRTELNAELDKCDEYEDSIRNIQRQLQSRLSNLQDSNADTVHSRYGSTSSLQAPNDVLRVSQQMRLPQIPMPEYGHRDGESLEKFISNLEAIFAKFNLSDYEKYVYLLGQLKNEALVLIKSLQGSNHSYTNAKDLLQQAFASPTVMKFEAINKMANLNLSYAGDCYEFVSNLKLVRQSFNSLQVSTEDIVQFFVWKAMPPGLQSQFIAITNNNKPTIDEIELHIFSAIERFSSFKKKPEKPKASALAANINYPDKKVRANFKPCCLCAGNKMEVDHPIHKCTVFASPSEKLDKLKSLGACLKCGYANHKTNACLFKFKNKCLQCAGAHFSYLCGNIKAKNINKNSSVSSGSIGVQCSQFNATGSGTILPTFTAETNNGNYLRALKDSGAQCSFILERVAEREKFRVIKNNLNLTVDGFNTSQKYKSKVVEVKVKLGGKNHTFPAMCVPDISTNMSLPGMGEIVSKFMSKGYKLADEKLLDPENESIANLDMILGSNATHCLPQSDRALGSESMFAETPHGVLLMGDSLTLLKSLDYLQPATEKNSQRACSKKLVKLSKQSKTKNPQIIDMSENFDYNAVSFNVCTFEPHDVVKFSFDKEMSELLGKPDDLIATKVLNYDECEKFDYNEQQQVVNDTIESITRSADGRLIVPLMWNSRNCHLLAKNYNLCYKLLKSNFQKLQKFPEKLQMLDDYFQDQIEQGVAEKIHDLKSFMEQNPQCSFLGHMPIFKFEKSTSKVRVVFLSNVSENSLKNNLSHNQVMNPGINYNKKITTAIMQLRFGKFFLSFDLVKAYLQLQLKSVDANRLCFLWLADWKNPNSEVIGLKCTRVAFGLRCSATLLMISLYYILMLDQTDDVKLNNLKKGLYDLFYVDNGGFVSDSEEEIQFAHENLKNIFNPFKFDVQKIFSNHTGVQAVADVHSEVETPVEVPVLRLNWNRLTDTLSCAPHMLDPAADSKRLILKTIASCYDVFNLKGPILNRARIFLHRLQVQENLSWDKKLSFDQIKEWRNICSQYNKSEKISIPRSCGAKNANYKLVAFSDSSAQIYGTVIYLKDLDSDKGQFLMAKNRFCNKALSKKTIPELELQSVVFGMETLQEVREELSGPHCVNPVNILQMELFSDSALNLHRVQSSTQKFAKMNKQSVFVKNRLEKISNLGDKFPVSFGFCAGVENPADAITRPLSYNQLVKSNYLSGPENWDCLKDNIISFTVPSQSLSVPDENSELKFCGTAKVSSSLSQLVDVERFSKFSKIVRIYSNVIKFCDLLKLKVQKKRGKSPITQQPDLYQIASRAYLLCIKQEQEKCFPDIFEYFNSNNSTLKNIPVLVGQLNIFRDEEGILRVKTKLRRWKDGSSNFPILLHKSGNLTAKIILEIHEGLCHGSFYACLTEFRNVYYVPHCFSTVKKIVRGCVICRRLNARTVKLNENFFREFKLNPSNIPFRNVFCDFLGPFMVKVAGQKRKVHLLILSCLWSRALNLILCPDLSTSSYLKGLQLHTFQYGVPSLILSDSGTSLIAGGNILLDLSKDLECQKYLRSNGIQTLKVEQYPKGSNELGGLVESGVKLAKRLLFGSIRNKILDILDFQFQVAQTVHLLNRRPLFFKEAVRDGVTDILPSPITPEILIRGYELVSMNLVPQLNKPLDDYVPFCNAAHVSDSQEKLAKCRATLVEIYNENFLSNLIEVSGSNPKRFVPVKHHPIKVGDVILLREPFLKPYNYPLAKVTKIEVNDLGEVTCVEALKGSTREYVRRHVHSIIPLLSDLQMEKVKVSSERTPEVSFKPVRAKRAAALKCRELLGNPDNY